MKDEERKLPFFISATPRTDLTSEAIKILDSFVNHYYDGDYVIDQVAFQIPCRNEGREASLGHFLTFALSNYVATKSDLTSERRNFCAGDLLTWMTHARGLGVIKDSESALTKLRTNEVENKRLRDNQQKLEMEILELKRVNEELHKALDLFGGRSDVAKNDVSNE